MSALGQTELLPPLPHGQTPHQVPAALPCPNQNLCKLKLQTKQRFVLLPPKACLPRHPSPPGCGWASPSGISTRSLTVGTCPHPTAGSAEPEPSLLLACLSFPDFSSWHEERHWELLAWSWITVGTRSGLNFSSLAVSLSPCSSWLG